MLTTAPPPRRRIEGAHATVQFTTPMTLTSKTSRTSCRGCSPNGRLYRVRWSPALLTRTLTSPSSATTVATAASTDSSSATSQPTDTARAPDIPAAVLRASFTSRSSSATAAPSAAKARAVAAPKPRAAPVTTATSPAHLPDAVTVEPTHRSRSAARRSGSALGSCVVLLRNRDLTPALRAGAARDRPRYRATAAGGCTYPLAAAPARPRRAGAGPSGRIVLTDRLREVLSLLIRVRSRGALLPSHGPHDCG